MEIIDFINTNWATISSMISFILGSIAGFATPKGKDK